MCQINLCKSLFWSKESGLVKGSVAIWPTFLQHFEGKSCYFFCSALSLHWDAFYQFLWMSFSSKTEIQRGKLRTGSHDAVEWACEYSTAEKVKRLVLKGHWNLAAWSQCSVTCCGVTNEVGPCCRQNVGNNNFHLRTFKELEKLQDN